MDTKNKFDVIIVGAGPAGLKCAERLKNSNLSVLLIEKNKIIGPKICAGGLPGLSTKLDFPDSKIKPFSKLVIYLFDKRHEINFPIKTIDRYDLGQYLLNKIKDAKNITILKETIVKQVKKDKVITNRGDFGYKYLVGADGSFSIVRKFLGLKSEISIGLYYESPKISDEVKLYFNPKLLGRGYIWVFPHRNHTNVGAGFHFDRYLLSFQKVRKILEEFLEKNNYPYSKNNLKGAPLNSFYKGCIFGNIFLVGDAAGLVFKIMGEGIKPAMISGEEIGKKILNPDYKLPQLNKILKIKKRQERWEKFFDASPFFKLKTYYLKVFINLMKISPFQSYFFGK